MLVSSSTTTAPLAGGGASGGYFSTSACGRGVGKWRWLAWCGINPLVLERALRAEGAPRTAPPHGRRTSRGGRAPAEGFGEAGYLDGIAQKGGWISRQSWRRCCLREETGEGERKEDEEDGKDGEDEEDEVK